MPGRDPSAIGQRVCGVGPARSESDGQSGRKQSERCRDRQQRCQTWPLGSVKARSGCARFRKDFIGFAEFVLDLEVASDDRLGEVAKDWVSSEFFDVYAADGVSGSKSRQGVFVHSSGASFNRGDVFDVATHPLAHSLPKRARAR